MSRRRTGRAAGDAGSPRQRALARARLRPADLARVATIGMRTRAARAALSVLGIAIGIGAMVATLGISATSQAGLLAEIDQLGSNLLTVDSGQTFTGSTAELPVSAPSMIARIGPVQQVAYTGPTSAAVYRSPLIPSIKSGGLSVAAASTNLPAVAGTSVAHGQYLNAATAAEPVAVLGNAAAAQLGIDRITPGERIWLGGQWFYVAGILNPAPLATEIDSTVLVGFQAAEHYLGFDGHPGRVYVRAATTEVTAVQAVLADTADPEDPSGVDVSQPSAALVARSAAGDTLSGLVLALGGVALLVGGVGVANTMVISVLERRGEIGLRRSLGSTRGHVRMQFLGEALVLSGLGGVLGAAAGALVTAGFALWHGWAAVVPTEAWAGGPAAALAVGVVAGLIPAVRAARLAPTEALRAL
jgi:putative ABC transport system permease protein